MSSPSSPRSPSASEAATSALAESRDEWILTDGAGGFASSTPSMRPARRYHGLLVAVRPGTAKRHLFVADLQEEVSIGSEGDFIPLGGAAAPLSSFDHAPFPTMGFVSGGSAGAAEATGSNTPSAAWRCSREILSNVGASTAGASSATLVRYTFTSTDVASCTLRVRPFLPCRDADSLTFANGECDLSIEEIGQAGLRCRPYPALPAVAVVVSSARVQIEHDPIWRKGISLALDEERGYDHVEDHPSPGCLHIQLRAGESVVVALSLDEPLDDPAQAWEDSESVMRTRRSRAKSLGGSVVRQRIDATAEDFLYRTEHGRLGICAGYPWFGEWGRDTFISLPGLTLARGNTAACLRVLDGAIPFLQNGLLPNIYGAGIDDSHYGSVDASLWYARAAEIYCASVSDSQDWALTVLRPALREIAIAYRDGTDLGVGANEDGLIAAGNKDLNPTWMDANASDGPVTPREGCAVEINALWFALLDHLAELEEAAGEDVAPWITARDLAGASFLRQFWLRDDHYLADRVHEGVADRAVRPNMVFAAALARSPLKPAMRRGIVDTVTDKLLTPRGLRTLSADHQDYVPRYRGGPDERDRAYHQGTVWPWLLGGYTEACLRARNTDTERARLRAIWDGFEAELDRVGLDHISEVFDGDAPHEPGGTFAQAWNTAELLRSYWLLER